MVCHMYRFCVNIRKGRQERNGKTLFLLCEAEVSVAIYAENLVQEAFFTTLDEELQFIYNKYSGVQRNNGRRWKVMQNYILEKLLTFLC